MRIWTVKYVQLRDDEPTVNITVNFAAKSFKDLSPLILNRLAELDQRWSLCVKTHDVKSITQGDVIEIPGEQQ